MAKQLYWGYLDIYGKVHVKRYTTDRAIENAESFPLTTGIFDPFYAKSLEEAKSMIMVHYAELILKGKN